MADLRPAAGAVRDDRHDARFVLERDGVTAELVYDTEPGRLILIHTGVPDALGGQGVGAQLVLAALARARAEQRTVVPWCPFARKWLRDHPDAAEGIELDWAPAPS